MTLAINVDEILRKEVIFADVTVFRRVVAFCERFPFSTVPELKKGVKFIHLYYKFSALPVLCVTTKKGFGATKIPAVTITDTATFRTHC